MVLTVTNTFVTALTHVAAPGPDNAHAPKQMPEILLEAIMAAAAHVFKFLIALFSHLSSGPSAPYVGSPAINPKGSLFNTGLLIT